ncbi:MAG: hypothetical protein A2Z95_06135 [Gallionellales bacterium GWA2_60_18]|nr:MAG: hypothetical protein A2Z95_06135 [Gallionellales bacterium GWA2_60_18]
MASTTKHPPAPQTCGTCATWTRHTDERMPDHGECAHRGVGYYSHRRSACLLATSLWSAKR